MKKKAITLTSIVLSLAIFACSLDISFANPTATLPPPGVTTSIPPAGPTATPSPPQPTPSYEDCSDPAVITYLEETETLVLWYAKFSKQFENDFAAGDKVAMRLDLENIQQITAEIEILTPPPLYANYHPLLAQELRGFTNVMIAVFNGDTDLAEAIAAKTDRIDAKRRAETTRINQFCHPPSQREET